MAKKIGAVLSGCGVMDGSEIHESVLTLSAIDRAGAEHVACAVTEFVVDKERKLLSTPSYMLAQRVKEAAEGIEKLVKQVIALA